jgi:hypothetical protein
MTLNGRRDGKSGIGRVALISDAAVLSVTRPLDDTKLLQLAPNAASVEASCSIDQSSLAALHHHARFGTIELPFPPVPPHHLTTLCKPMQPPGPTHSRSVVS